MNPLTNFIALAARLLLAVLFVQGGWNKLFGGIPGTVINMANHGIPLPHILVWGAVLVELGIGLCLIAGLFARWAALILAGYTAALGLIFHAYWLAPAADMRFERIIFFNHISIIGGMLAIVAFGGGCLSLDALMRRERWLTKAVTLRCALWARLEGRRPGPASFEARFASALIALWRKLAAQDNDPTGRVWIVDRPQPSWHLHRGRNNF